MPHPKGTEMNSEQRARELLADELEADGRDSTAAQIRAGKTPSVVTGIALRAIARALEQPASAAGVEGWRPIETAPKDGRMIVLFWNGAWCPGFYLDNSHTQFPWAGWRVPSGQLTPPGQPTHYMEPAAPKPEDAS